MPTTRRVRPMVEFTWPDSTLDSIHLLPRSPILATDAISFSRARQDYTVRQAFLRSYQFSVKESVGERLWRSLKEVGETGKTVLLEAFDRMFDRRFRASVFRAFSLRLPRSAMDPLGCFKPRKNCYLEDFV